jgi:hypothetical protein
MKVNMKYSLTFYSRKLAKHAVFLISQWVLASLNFVKLA